LSFILSDKIYIAADFEKAEALAHPLGFLIVRLSVTNSSVNFQLLVYGTLHF